MKDSFIMYNSFYEPIKTLKNEQLGKLLRAIFNYTISGEITQDNDILIAFMFIKNQLDIDAEKWKDIKQKRSEAGKKHKGNQYTNRNKMEQMEQNGTNGTVNENDNDNVNVNDNVNDIYNNSSSSYNNNIYGFAEKNIGRMLTPIEFEKIDIWKNNFNEEIIKYAIQIAVLNNKKTFNYINGILNNWKSKGYKTLKEIKENDFKIKNKEEIEIPNWMEDYNWLEEDVE